MKEEKEPKSTRLQVRRLTWWSAFQSLNRLETEMQKEITESKIGILTREKKRELWSYEYPCPSSIGWKSDTLVEGNKAESLEGKEDIGK